MEWCGWKFLSRTYKNLANRLMAVFRTVFRPPKFVTAHAQNLWCVFAVKHPHDFSLFITKSSQSLRRCPSLLFVQPRAHEACSDSLTSIHRRSVLVRRVCTDSRADINLLCTSHLERGVNTQRIDIYATRDVSLQLHSGFYDRCMQASRLSLSRVFSVS
jgi:hypothetical protein